MKKTISIFIICICLLLSTGCKKSDEARARVAVKNANGVIKAIRLNYILDQTKIITNQPYEVLSLTNLDINVKSGTYTILSTTAQNDESQIQLNDVVIDDHICNGVKGAVVCKKIIKNES